MLTHEQVQGGWRSTLHGTLPGGALLAGVGESRRKSQADIAACEKALATVNLEQDKALLADAGLGDALIKLAAYSDPEGVP